MFKWPGTPSARADDHEVADFAELICIRDGLTSATGVMSALSKLEENDYATGVPEDEQEVDRVVEDAFFKIERRISICGPDRYPFELSEQGYTLKPKMNQGQPRLTVLYIYLLLATRLNMSSNRTHGGIDGSLLFETLSAEVAESYFGDRSLSLVFGTAAGPLPFPERINELCRSLGEGNGFRNRDQDNPRENDGKLDIVAWKPFCDGEKGKLIAFGQCKTGTEWKNSLHQLQPDAFCKKWLLDAPVNTPLRLFFVSEALPRTRWYTKSCDAGVLFDRCRIMDYAPVFTEPTNEQLVNWLDAAAQSVGLPTEMIN